MTNATYRLSLKDYSAFCQRRSVRTAGIMGILIWLVIGIVSATRYGWGAWPGMAPFLVAFVILYGGYVLVFIPHWAARTYEEQVSLSEKRMVAFDADRIYFSQHSGTLTPAWRDILMWEETPRLLVLYVSRAMFVPVVKDGVGPDVTDAIRQALIKSGLPRPMKRRKHA